MPKDVGKVNNLSISNLDNWEPPTEPVAKADWTPPSEPINAKKEEEPSSNIIDLAEKYVFEAPEFVKKGAQEIANKIDVERPETKGSFIEALKGIPDIASGMIHNPLETMRGGLAGMTEGAANLLSPANIASTAMPEYGLVNKGLGALQGIAGANKLSKGDISGLGDIGFGILGMRGKGNVKPDILPPQERKLLGPGQYNMPSSSIIDEGGRDLGGTSSNIAERPSGPWDKNKSTEISSKTDLYDLARNKFNMGKDLPSDIKPKAVFKGWQEDGEGGHYALYDIHGGPLNRSTVSEQSLKSNGIEIPETPKFSKENAARDAAIARQKARIDITEGFGGSGHPESPEYVGKVLAKAGKGKPGLSLDDLNNGDNVRHIVYRDKEGNPIVAAKIVSDSQGKLLVQDMAADKSKGLLTGRAVSAVANKLKEIGATESAGTKSKDAKNLIERMTARAKEPIESPTLKNLFTGETGAVKFGANKQKPIKPSTRSLRQPSDEVVGRLVDAIKAAGPKRETQEKLYSEERAARIKKAEQVKETGLPGFYKQLHELKGELPKVDFERTKISQKDVNDLINYVTNSQVLLPYEKIRAKIGLLKILSAKREELPQRSELALLSEVFGKKFDDVVMMHGGFGGPVAMKAIADIANMPKAIMASIDLSAPLRQGLPLIHKKEWWSALRPMVESFGSQERYDALQASIKERPGYLFGKKSGLKLTDMGNHQEEAYDSRLAERIIPGVKASERAYVGFLNKLRADTFDGLVQSAVDAGHDPKEIGPFIAKFVNTATGRGDLGRLDRVAKELNTVFFSPRLIASRLTILNPNTYINPKIPSFVRQESLKSLMAIAGFSITMDSLAHAAGASVNLDPTNTDFMKAKFGNTRMDPNGGLQQYVVAASRLLTGKTTSSTTGITSQIGKKYGSPTRASMIFGVGDKYGRSFMENKFSPLVGLADDILAGRQPDQNGLGGMIAPNSYRADVINRFVPLMVNDMIDVYKDDPNAFASGKALLGAGGALGMGMQTYQPNQKKSSGLRISVR